MLEAAAFPAALTDAVSRLLPALSTGQLHPPSAPFEARQDGRLLRIPVRTYYARAALLAATGQPGDAGAVALCLGTRHHDGRLREHCVAQLLLQERAWTVPFVVHLCGEYVLEIVERIGAALPAWNAGALARYLRENPAHVATLERRAVSYWNCYYRAQYPVWDAYPGCRAMAALRALQRT